MESLAIIAGLSALFFAATGVVLALGRLPLRAEYFASAAAIVTGAAIVPRVLQAPQRKEEGQAFLATLRSWLILPGSTSRQRTIGRIAVVGTFVAIVALIAMATIPPAATPDLQLALVGPDRRTTSLPTGADVATTLQVFVYLRNSADPGNYTLRLRANISPGLYSGGYSQVTWVLPLYLKNGTESSTNVNLLPGEVRNVPVEFSFSSPGEYALQFDLLTPSGSIVRSVMLPIVVR